MIRVLTKHCPQAESDKLCGAQWFRSFGGRALPCALALAFFFAAVILTTSTALAQQNITINYPARAPADWPLFLAQEGGYYHKYGYNVKLVFGVHPAGIAMVVSGEAAMTNYSLEQAMEAAEKDGSLVIVGSPLTNGLFALMAGKNVKSVRDLKGKRVGVSQLGDAPYNFTRSIFERFGLSSRDVQWVPLGTDVNGRVAALISGRVDATMITPPAYFRLEEKGYKSLANLADFSDIYAPMAYVFKKSVIAAHPELPERMLKAYAEATKRFYDDKNFAVTAYMKYDPQTRPDVERIYDHDSKAGTYERIPYVLAPAIQYIVTHQVDPRIAAEMKAYDFHKVVDNSYVDRLVKEGFFEKLFGPGIKAEEQKKSKIAFR
jgi:ABC-type nitrate/sulfonate/bicarbonate transport system substrate-binding protein